jgi:hypothetical protein
VQGLGEPRRRRALVAPSARNRREGLEHRRRASRSLTGSSDTGVGRGRHLSLATTDEAMARHGGARLLRAMSAWAAQWQTHDGVMYRQNAARARQAKHGHGMARRGAT